MEKKDVIKFEFSHAGSRKEMQKIKSSNLVIPACKVKIESHCGYYME